jgi:hypothetical protein
MLTVQLICVNGLVLPEGSDGMPDHMTMIAELGYGVALRVYTIRVLNVSIF